MTLKERKKKNVTVSSSEKTVDAYPWVALESVCACVLACVCVCVRETRSCNSKEHTTVHNSREQR